MFFFSYAVLPTISNLSSSAPGNKIILPRTGFTFVNIYCTARGDASSVSFYWTLNSVTVPNSSTYKSNNGNSAIGRLYIYPVRPTHGGTYRCSTSNNVGNRQQDLAITVVGRYDGTEWVW